MDKKTTPLENGDLIDMLLKSDVPDIRKKLPKAKMEIKRLSALTGRPVVLEIQALSYGRVQSLLEMPEKDIRAQIIVEGCAFFRDSRLLNPDKNIATPVDAVESLLNPGEIQELSVKIEQLSGYRQKTISEIKN